MPISAPPQAPVRSPGDVTTVDRRRRPHAVVVAIDDDPTGAQTVAGVPLVTAYDVPTLRWLLRGADRLGFLLTNSRSLTAAEAVEVAGRVADALATAAEAEGVDVRLLSRSDSTLRGHFPAEVDTLLAAWHAAGGPRHDGVLLCPAYVEAGRATLHGRHWVRTGARWLPVAETDYARDASFGYTASDLPAWAAERSGGRLRAADVPVLDIETLRRGVDETRRALLAAPAGAIVAADALDSLDLEVLGAALDAADLAGRRFLLRTGPSLVRASTGLPAADPVALPRWGHRPRVLVAVGSHTPLTRRQVAEAVSAHPLTVVELPVRDVLGPDRALALDRAAAAGVRGMTGGDVVIQTSTQVVLGAGGEESLRVARQVASALTEVIRRVVAAAGPDVLVAKGGITSHDIAAQALGMARARVRGSLLPGQLSVWEPAGHAAPGHTVADRPAPAGPVLVVFPGNVGDDGTLCHVLDLIHSADRPSHRGDR